MSYPSQAVSPVEVAKRLKIARNIAQFTLEQAAQASKVSSLSIKAIEAGEREFLPEEFFQLAKAYGRTPSEVIHSKSLDLVLVPCFKATASLGQNERKYAINRLNNLAKLEFDLEYLLGYHKHSPTFQERPLVDGDVTQQGIDAAIEIRKQHGFGKGPIGHIDWILEKEFGFRVYFDELDSTIKGLYAFNCKLGPCILINSLNSRDELLMASAHELGHFIGTRVQSKTNGHDYHCSANSEEMYANAFADEFILPAESMKLALEHYRRARVKFSYDNMYDLAKIWNVSIDLLCRRLENLKYVNKGTFDRLRKNRSCQNIRTNSSMVNRVRYQFRSRLNLLIAEAFDQGKISEGELVDRLGLDRISLRDLIYDHTQEGYHDLCTVETG